MQILSKYGSVDLETIRTQKAKGMGALYQMTGMGNFNAPSPCYLLQSPDDVEAAWWQIAGVVGGKNSFFARPCPTVPRHGFVESRPISTKKELQQVWDETMEQDANGEVLLLPTINSSYNYIFTPTAVAVGPGNDGATAGKNSVSIPLATFKFGSPEEEVFWKKAAGVKEEPFFEAVQDKNYRQIYITQMRSGPALPRGKNYIPLTTHITRVVEVNDEMSLLDWETLTKTLSEGDVVYHANGNLASHFAVHCVVAGIPYVVDPKPEVGDILTPEGGVEYDLEKVKLGVAKAYAHTLTQDRIQDVTTAAFSILHNATVLGGEFSELVGFGAGIIHRLAIVALLGELRHAKGNRRPQNREDVYEWALKNPWTSRRKLYRAAKGFATFHWSSGYGGAAWASIAAATFRLDSGIKDLYKNREGALEEVLSGMNLIVNTLHNGGRSLNKFISESTMDYCAANSLHVLHCYARYGWKVMKQMEVPTQWLEQWGKARQLRIKLTIIESECPMIRYGVMKPKAGTSYFTYFKEYKDSRGEIQTYQDECYSEDIHDEVIEGDYEWGGKKWKLLPIEKKKGEWRVYFNKKCLFRDTIKKEAIWGGIDGTTTQAAASK